MLCKAQTFEQKYITTTEISKLKKFLNIITINIRRIIFKL